MMESRLLLLCTILLVSGICYIPFSSYLQTSWNYDYLKPLDYSKSNDWGFSIYFDDRYNFLDYPHLNSLFPQQELYEQYYTNGAGSKELRADQHIMLLPSLSEHWKNIFIHRGINVYEPVYNFHRALFFDIFGFHPIKLRILSIIMHTLNTCLLFWWLRYVFDWNRFGSMKLSKEDEYSISTYNKSKILLPIVLACVVFYVHPLNMEVIGWLSAQGYVFAMFYALLGLIITERFFFLAKKDPTKLSLSHQLSSLIMTIVFYLLASWSKAPAMMLSFVLMLRVFAIATFRYASNEIVSWNAVLLWMGGCMVAFLGLLLCTISSNEVSVPDINAVELLKVETSFPYTATIKLIRAMTIFGGFFIRFLAPSDLRSHYYAPPSSHFLMDSMLTYQPHYVIAVSISIVLALSSLYWVNMICSSVLTNGLNLSLSKASSDLHMLVRCGHCAFGLISFALMWIPGCGLIQHGWTQLGADRYNYFPIALISPLLVQVFEMILNENNIPVFTIIDQIEPVGREEVPNVGDAETNDDGHEMIARKPLPIKPFPSRDDKPSLKAILKSKLGNLQISQEDSNDGSDCSGSTSPLASPSEGSSAGHDSSKKRVKFVLPDETTTAVGSKAQKKDKQRLQQKQNQSNHNSKRFAAFTTIKIEERRQRKSRSMSFLALSMLLAWCAMLAMVGRCSFNYWKNDQVLLSNCIRLDPQDWECAQYLSTFHLLHSGKQNLAEYFNAMTIHLMPTEPPRLQMFKATLLVQSPFPVQQHRNVRSAIYGATDKDWNSENLSHVESTENLLHACSVVDSVVEALINRILTYFPEYQQLLINSSFDEQFYTIFTTMDILSKLLEDQVPMIISNQVTCYLYRGGLNGRTASRAIEILKYSFEKLGFSKIHAEYVDKQTKPLFAQHIISIRNHINNLEYWSKFQSGSYDAVFLH